MTVSAECISRRSKRRKTIDELEKENAKLRQELADLKTRFGIPVQRKRMKLVTTEGQWQ